MIQEKPLHTHLNALFHKGTQERTSQGFDVALLPRDDNLPYLREKTNTSLLHLPFHFMPPYQQKKCTTSVAFQANNPLLSLFIPFPAQENDKRPYGLLSTRLSRGTSTSATSTGSVAPTHPSTTLGARTDPTSESPVPEVFSVHSFSSFSPLHDP